MAETPPDNPLKVLSALEAGKYEVLCDCFARFAVVSRYLDGDYETSPHSKAKVRNRDWRKRVSGIENRLSRKQSGSWTYRLLGHNRYEPSGACTGRECGEKWRILRIR